MIRRIFWLLFRVLRELTLTRDLFNIKDIVKKEIKYITGGSTAVIVNSIIEISFYPGESHRYWVKLLIKVNRPNMDFTLMTAEELAKIINKRLKGTPYVLNTVNKDKSIFTFEVLTKV